MPFAMRVLALTIIALGAGRALAQVAGAPQGAPAVAPTTAAVVTRADLAAAYLAFDKAVTRRPPAAADLGAVNRAFDGATISFFAGRHADAVRAIHELTARLLGDTAVGANSRLAAFRVSLEPRVAVRAPGTSAPMPIWRLMRLYGPRAHGGSPFAAPAPIAPETLRLVATISNDERRASPIVETFSVVVGEPGAAVTVAATSPGFARAAPGRYRIELRDAAQPLTSPTVLAGEWFVTDRDPDAQRADFIRRAQPLDTIVPPELLDAVTTFKARTRNLTNSPSASSTAQLQANPVALGRALEEELRQLAGGSDPYRDRAGDLWRVLPAPGRVVPLRTYVPISVARSRSRAPLVIALHGAGGDENMFPDALGDGQLLRLAEQHGFVVVSPATDLFGATPGEFDRLVALISSAAAIDKSRIYVIGHSRGAGQAMSLAGSRAAALAGVACLAGFGRAVAGAPLAPTLVVLGELDPLAAPARLVPAIEQAVAAGLPIELRIVPQQGHTLTVNAALADAVAWLMPKRLAPIAPAGNP